MSRGNALIEILVVGFIGVLLALQVLTAAARLEAAGNRASQAAQTAALWAARSGSAADAEAVAASLSPQATITAWRDGQHIHVIVSESVGIFGAGSGLVDMSVDGRGIARVSNYRSDG